MLEIPHWLLMALHKHCLEEHPLEASGMVARRKPAGSVDAWYRHTPMKNLSPNPRFAYAWGEGQQVDLWDTMDREGSEPWVIYHSHTESVPEPSTIDRGAAWFPGVHYLIFSTAGAKDDVWYESWLCTEPGLLVHEQVVVLP